MRRLAAVAAALALASSPAGASAINNALPRLDGPIDELITCASPIAKSIIYDASDEKVSDYMAVMTACPGPSLKIKTACMAAGYSSDACLVGWIVAVREIFRILSVRHP